MNYYDPKSLVTKEFWELQQKRKREQLTVAAEERVKITDYTVNEKLPHALDLPHDDAYLNLAYCLIRRAVELKDRVDQIEGDVPLQVRSQRKGKRRKGPKLYPHDVADRVALALTDYAIFMRTPKVARPDSWPQTIGEIAAKNKTTITTLAQWRHRYAIDELLPLIPEVVTKDDVLNEVAGALVHRAMTELGDKESKDGYRLAETVRRWYGIGEKRGGIQINNTVVNQAPTWSKEELDEERRKMREVEAEVSDG